MKPGALACLALIVAAGRPAPSTASDAQQRFLAALQLVQQGQAEAGADALRALYAEEPTPRIRLELARALMLARRWAEARRLFVEAYKDNPPPGVRANILNLIGYIDRRKGTLTLTASAARYGNPLQQPKSFSFSIDGVDLAYEPDREYRNLWGVTVGGHYVKETAGGVEFSADASWRELPHHAADRFTGEVYVAENLRGMLLRLKQGVIRLGQERQSFTLPYLQFAYSVPVGRKSALRPTVTTAYYLSDWGRNLSGFQPDISLPYVHVPDPSRVFSAGPFILWHGAGLPEQRYTSWGLRALFTAQGDVANVEVAAQARITRFHATDPFWQVRRKDKSAYLSLAVSSDRVRLGPFLPAIGVSCSLTQSSVRYFQQSNCDTFLSVNKLF